MTTMVSKMHVTNEQTDSPLAICLDGVNKQYRHFSLSGISLAIPRGVVAGLIGPNGAGKTTTMRILMGLVHPDRGRVKVLGQDISLSASNAKHEIGYFSDDMRLYKPESIRWHMQFVKSMIPTWDEDYARELVHRFGLIPEQAIKSLSHGQRVKAMLLLVLARRPKLLILDEPTNGLDPVAKHEVHTEIMRVVEDESRTILYSSHNTQDVEQICDSITFIDRGKIVTTGDREEFLSRWKRLKLVVPRGWKVPVVSGLHVDSELNTFRVLTCEHFSGEVRCVLLNSGAIVESVEPLTLEEIFIHAVMRGREGESR
ncbi:ABC transporter ATP-binding protein [Pirellulaceae bacterium SH449]